MYSGSVSALRRFVRPREGEERCDTCGKPLPEDHAHTFEAAVRRIRCACAVCARLYETVHKAVPRRIRALPDFQLSDWQWDELAIPISLAFFCFSTPARKMVVFYPGPAGAAESMLRLDIWQQIVAANPQLSTLEPDVEALLVNRAGATREHFLVPIDECYRLVGLIRIHWRGLSGGSKVWGEIVRFFDGLREKSDACQA